jgi:hypothetical protein
MDGKLVEMLVSRSGLNQRDSGDTGEGIVAL